MKQNARYRGGSGTGVDLEVPLVDGQVRRVHCKQGEALPTDFLGVPVDAEWLERLLEQTESWEAVDDKTASPKRAAAVRPDDDKTIAAAATDEKDGPS